MVSEGPNLGSHACRTGAYPLSHLLNPEVHFLGGGPDIAMVTGKNILRQWQLDFREFNTHLTHTREQRSPGM